MQLIDLSDFINSCCHGQYNVYEWDHHRLVCIMMVNRFPTVQKISWQFNATEQKKPSSHRSTCAEDALECTNISMGSKKPSLKTVPGKMLPGLMIQNLRLYLPLVGTNAHEVMDQFLLLGLQAGRCY
ncbi:UNVERIFIED_CONTAM: hypothetical protein NCL1_28072 [Trichonephila clavipes]